jgi:hypothetical protein
MTKAERLAADLVIEAALAWWRMKRPIGWPEAQHRANPAVNARETASAERLAEAAGRLVNVRVAKIKRTR